MLPCFRTYKPAKMLKGECHINQPLLERVENILEDVVLSTLSMYKLVLDSYGETKKEMLSRSSKVLKMT